MKIKNCLYNHEQLAEKFVELAEKFLVYSQQTKVVIDFSKYTSIINVHGTKTSYIGLVSCILKPLEIHNSTPTTDAHLTADYFGFYSRYKFSDWLTVNSNIWGNVSGHTLFFACGYEAFNKTENENISVLDFVQKHIEVADPTAKSRNN